MGHTGEAIDTNVSALIKTTVAMSTTEDSVDVDVGEVVTVVVAATKGGREVVPEDVVVRRPQVLAIGVVVAADGTTTRGGTE